MTTPLRALRRSYHDARRSLARVVDVRAHVVEHPLASVGLAFGAGLYAGLRSGVSHRAPRTLHHKLFDTTVAAFGTMLVTLARDAAIRGVREWVEGELAHS